MKNKPVLLILIILPIILILLGFYRLAGFNVTRTPQSDTKTSIASVNGITIKRLDFEKKLEEQNNFFEYSKQKISEKTAETAEKDVLEKMIDEKLIENYAKDHKITASQGEISFRYQRVVENFNKGNNYKADDDSLFLAKIKEMYGEKKEDYLEIIRMDILKEKVQGAVKIPLANWLTKQKNVSDIQRY